MTLEFPLRPGGIRLDQLLKAVGWVGSGGEAHRRIDAGDVRVDGQREMRRRARLAAGQQVSLDGQTVRLVDTPAEAEDGKA